MTVPSDKSAIREKNLAQRMHLAPASHAAWSRTCCEQIYDLICALAASNNAIIGGYAPIKAELDVMPVLRKLAKDSHIIALPVMEKEAGKRQLIFHPWKPGEKLTPKTYGIHEPDRHSAPVIPDIVIVPLLAFDRRGHRVGYGGGHYDVMLRKLRVVKPDALTIGAAFSQQEEALLPDNAYDERLSRIVTEKEVIVIR